MNCGISSRCCLDRACPKTGILGAFVETFVAAFVEFGSFPTMVWTNAAAKVLQQSPGTGCR
jgi:hypothetical protein